MNVRVATSFLLALLLVLGACSDDGDDEQVVLPTPTASAEAPEDDPSPTPSPTASAEAPDDGGEIDVTTIPDEITPAYVEAVYDEIARGRLPYTVAVLNDPPNDLGALPTGTRDGLESWLDGTQLDVAIASLEDLATNADRRADFRSPAELQPTTAEVLRIVHASESCLVAVARLDDSGLSPSGGPRDVLTILSFSRNPDQSDNRTDWVLRDQLRNTNSDGEPNPDSFALEADLETIAAAADVTCGEGDQ